MYGCFWNAPLALCEGSPPVTGDFPSQRAINAGYDAFFDVNIAKRFNKQSQRRWFETPWHSLLRHCYASPNRSLKL